MDLSSMLAAKPASSPRGYDRTSHLWRITSFTGAMGEKQIGRISAFSAIGTIPSFMREGSPLKAKHRMD
jgi:hypothetical protein